MKHLLSLMLCLMLVLAMGGGALAAEYEPTDMFLAALEEDDFFLSDYSFSYEYRGLDSDEDDCVLITFDLAEAGEKTVAAYIMSTETSSSMYLWDLIVFDESDRDEVVDICNELNTSYRFARWYAMDDSTVNVQVDCIFRAGDGCGEALVETLSMLVAIAERGYPSLEEYAI